MQKGVEEELDTATAWHVRREGVGQRRGERTAVRGRWDGLVMRCARRRRGTNGLVICRRGEKAGLLSTVEDLDGRVKYLEAKCSRLLRDSEAARAALRNDDGRGSYLATQARGVRRSMRAGNESSVLASTPSKLGVAGGA